MRNIRLLHIEDDPGQREKLTALLRERGFDVRSVGDGREGIELFQSETFDIVLCDLNMGPIDGLTVLQAVKQAKPETPVVILTAHGSVAMAIEAIKQGAYRFVLKPVEVADLELTIYQAIEHATLEGRLAEYSRGLERTVEERSGRLEFANRQLQALNEVSNRLIQIKREDRLIEAAPELLTKALDFDRATLLLVREGKLEIGSMCFPKDPPEMVRSLAAAIEAGEAPFGPAIIEEALTGRTVLIRDLNADPRWRKAPGEVIRTKAIIISPIRSKETVIGLIVANMQHHEREMDEQDVARFEMFANMVGLAFENVRAYRSLEQEVDERTVQLRNKARQLESSSIELAKANVELLGVQERLEEKNAELAGLLSELSRSKDRLQAILDSAYNVIVMVDQSGSIVATNAQLQGFFGFPPELIKGQPFARFLGGLTDCFASPEELHRMVAHLQEHPDTDAARYARPELIADRALLVTCPSERWVAIYSVPVKQSGGEELGRVWMFADVTKIKQAEDQVRALVEAAPIPSIISRVSDGRILYVNDHLAELVGVKKEDVIGLSTVDFYYDPEDRQQLVEILQGNGIIRNHEVQLRKADGLPVWVLVSLVVTAVDGQDVIVGGMYDITQRKAAEEALRRERNFVSAILDTAGALITVLNPEGQIISFNRACEATTGYRFEEVMGKPFWDMLLTDEEREPTMTVFRSLLAGDFPNTAENHWLTKGGEKRLIAWSNTVLTDAVGDVEYIIATGIDITEIRRAEEKLRLYHRIFETSGDGITIFDRQNRLIARNPAHRQYAGYDDDELLTGESAAQLIGREHLDAVLEGLRAKGEFRGEVFVRSKDGQERPVDLAVFQIRDESGEVLYTVGMGRDITARKEAERALQQAHDELERRVEERTAELRDSEAKNRALLSVIPDLMFRLSREGVYLDYRAPKGSPLEVPAEQVVGLSVSEALPPLLADETMATITRALESREIQVLEYELPHQDDIHSFEARVVVSGSDEVMAIVRDITDRKRAEEALRRAHDELEMRVEQRTAQLARVNEALRDEVRDRRQAQEALADRLRYEEGLADCSQVLLTVEKVDQALDAVLEHLRDAAVVSRTYVFENFEDPADGLCMRQTFEKCAPGIEAQLDNPLLQHLPYDQLFGRWQGKLSRGEPVMGTIADLPSDEREVIEAQSIKSILVLPITVNGGWYGFIGFDDCVEERQWTREDIRALRTAAEMIGVYMARSRAQEALRYSEERFRSLVENAHDVIFSVTPDGRFTYISPQFTELTGQLVSEFIGQPIFPLMHPDNARESEQWFQSGLTSDMISTGYEFRAHHKDGSWRWFVLNGSIIRNEAGDAEEVVGILHDITEIKKVLQDIEQANRNLRDTQAQLVQSEKMASLGMLVAGIAHEINTPVGAISSMHDTLIRAVERLRTTLETNYGEAFVSDKKLQTAFSVIGDANRVIESGANRVTTIVRRLRSFARLDEAELKKADIHEGLEDTLTLIYHEIKHTLTIVRDYGEVPSIRCYPGRLNQVFLNLFNNSRQAITQEGEIRITTRADKDWVTIAIADTGHGIAKEHLKHIFDPGFTTKGVGVGTGLGLSICYQIIREHHGEISVASEPGKGTTFTIKLPTDLDARLAIHGDATGHTGN